MDTPKILGNIEQSIGHVCGDCGKKYGTTQALTAHRRVHLPKKPLKDDTFFRQKKEPDQLYDEFIKNMRNTPTQDWYRPSDLIVKVKKLPHGRNLPNLQKATPGSAAVDLYAAIDHQVWVGAQDRAIPPIPTGIAIELPPGYVAKITPRSGLAAKHGVSITNSPGIIDSDYRGEIMITLINHGRAKICVNPGDRIAQMLVEKVEPVEFEYVDELSDTERGAGGFGSTGISRTVEAGKTINFNEQAGQPRGQEVRKLPPDHDLIRNRT